MSHNSNNRSVDVPQKHDIAFAQKCVLLKVIGDEGNITLLAAEPISTTLN